MLEIGELVVNVNKNKSKRKFKIGLRRVSLGFLLKLSLVTKVISGVALVAELKTITLVIFLPVYYGKLRH